MKSFQLNHLMILFALALFTFAGCKKEDPLKPNKEAGKFQTENNAGDGGFGNGGGNNGGGNTGGGGNSSAHFTASINGKDKSFPFRSYSDNQLGVIVSGSNNSSQESISIMLLNKVVEGDTMQLSGANSASYTISTTSVYSSTGGAIIFDKVTSTYVKGSFYFNAEEAMSSKTVKITNGSFYIER